MKFLLLLPLTLITFFAPAQHTNALGNHEGGSTMNMSCIFIFCFICLAIAAASFYVANKRRGRNDNSHTEKNT